METCTKPSTSNENDKSKKYKFYRKPSIKKKGPEVKHTKTSLARLLKANPLLKLETSTKNGPPSNTEIKLGPVNTEAPKMCISNGNGPYLKSRIINFDKHRLSSSDFINPILSSTLIESDDAFNGQSSQALIKSLPKITSKKEENLNNNVVINKKNEKRKSLSSQYLHKKKKEFKEITKKQTVSTGFSKNRIVPLRRSLSADNLEVCYRIEEEEDNLLESKSTQSLSQESEEVATRSVLNAIAWEDLKTRLDRPSVKQITIPNNGELYDDENKENIEASILESDSYEDLKICKGDDLK